MLRENWQGQCWHCGHQLSASDYNRENRCPNCSKATYACRNCRYYQSGLANDCREPIAEHVTDKERANFCDYFSPGDPGTDTANNPVQDDFLSAADDLFK